MNELPTWKITWGEYSWTDADATGAHIVAVADILGADQWKAINPWNGPKALAAWCVVLLATRYTGDLDKALAEVYGAPVATLLEALTSRD